MVYGGSWDYLPAAAGANFPIGMEQFPTYVSGSPPGAAGGPGIVAAVYSGSPKADLPIEKKWVHYISSPQADKELATLEQPPALPVAAGVKPPVSATSGSGHAAFSERETLSQFAPRTFTFLDWTWPTAVTTAFQNDIQAVMGGAMTPRAALADIQSTFAQQSK
jgi:ABC-type glycerol-3-phosphate transport system substrate-binding protein